MSKAYEFLKECGYFYVLTVNGDFPAGRPFGAVMEVGDDLYIATHDGNQAHAQLRWNSHVQLIAKKEHSRAWLRVTGVAEECSSVPMKARMMEECPVLKTRFASAESEHFLLFKITVINSEFL